MEAKRSGKSFVRSVVLTAAAALLLLGCFSAWESTERKRGSGKIFLYGESHAVESIMLQELELWSDYYHNHGMRHFFVEYPCYTAAYLNLWMQSDNNDILNAIYDNLEGTAAHTPLTLEFYKRIKTECPETIFHGTDVGHQYDTTGKRFLEYLEENGQKDTELYRLSKENVEQGKYYYGHSGDPKGKDNVYRENKMAENFIREFESLNGEEDIMGIYGTTHTLTNGLDWATQTVPSMGNQIYQKYDDALTVEELKAAPIRTDTVTVGEKAYTANYFGKAYLSGLHGYEYREYWRLEDAYEDFQSKPTTGDVLPYDNYPMEIEKGQVFFIRYTGEDGSTEEEYRRSDGTVWREMPVTSKFEPDK